MDLVVVAIDVGDVRVIVDLQFDIDKVEGGRRGPTGFIVRLKSRTLIMMALLFVVDRNGMIGD